MRLGGLPSAKMGGCIMAVYKSVQFKTLMDFLIRNSDKPLTIEAIATLIRDENSGENVPGKSTVYRLMKKLVADGTVKRFVSGNSRRFVYQLAGRDCNEHLHLKCTKCGRLFHMDDIETGQVIHQILRNNNFKIDRETTVLLGSCINCPADKARG